jgi:amino acid transporter
MQTKSPGQLERAIGRWGLTALVLNSIIGSGIFGLPSLVAVRLGSASTYAYLLAAGGVGLIMACFAEVASRFTGAGGPYLYAREAFGRFIGIQMGWLAWLVRLTAAGANANLFVIYLGEFWPDAGQPISRVAILTLMIGWLALVNIVGVRSGANLSSWFAAFKLAPLLLFIFIGLPTIGRTPVLEPAVTGFSSWMEAVLVLVFAYGGFEAALMPLSEARDPQRDAPFALLSALGLCTVLYTLIHLVVLGALGNPGEEARPLAAAARQFMGHPGAVLITLGALVSVFGYLSSQMLNAPRLTYALSEQGDFPPAFRWIHPRFRTPWFSILAFAVLLWILAVAGSFKWNVYLSAVSRLFTYGLVCAALPALRAKTHTRAIFHLRWGTAFAVLGMAFSLALLARMGWIEMAIIAATIFIAWINWLLARRLSR